MRNSLNHGSGNWFPGFLLTVALCAVATITGCALDSEAPPTTSEVVPTEEETNVDLGTSIHALKIGCASHAECSIETLAGEGYAIATNGCLLEDALCADLPGGITGCLGTAVNLVCANNLQTEVFCNDGIDNDNDGVADGDDIDCQGTLCDLDESVTCMTIGIWTNGDCVANPNPDGTFCGSDDVCQTDSYCDGGACVEDDSTSECCFIDSECADYACPSGQAPFCTPMQLELGSGLCGCFGINTEICYDGLDNDGNGLRDCEDPACGDLAHCNSTASCCAPHDGVGCEDKELMMDVCAHMDNDEFCCRTKWDQTCAYEANELTKVSSEDPGLCSEPEVCDDGVDNDFDFLADCDDPACSEFPTCVPPEPVCGEDLSCADQACDGDPACPIEPPTDAISIMTNVGYTMRGCVGNTWLPAVSHMACDVSGWDNTGFDNVVLQPGQGLLFNVLIEETGFTVPDITSLGPPVVYNLRGETVESIFAPGVLAGLDCQVVGTAGGGENWRCVNGTLAGTPD